MSVKNFHDYLVYADGRIYSNLTNNNHFNNNAKNLEWVTCKENNRRARENGFNNVSLSNSNRWNCEEFRKKTAQNISAGQIASGCFSGKKNPRYRFEIHCEYGKIYMMSELNALTGKSLTWVYNHIVEFLNGKDVPEFKNCGISSIIDLKGKVNRLSKA